MKILCFGDSLTSCGGEGGRFSDILQERFPGHTFCNRGAGGETFLDARARLEPDVLALSPDIVLIEFGSNDWWRDERPCTAWAADLDYCVGRIVESGARVVVLGVFGPCRDAGGRLVPKTRGTDWRGIAYRKLEAEIAAKHGCSYVANIQEGIDGDRCSWLDSNHPNEYGNRSVADAVEPVIEELLGCRARPVRKPALGTLHDVWREAVELAPDGCAAVDGGRRLTYREADRLVARLAGGLREAAGVSRPKVAVFLPNCLEYYIIYWAVMRLGGVVVPLNTWLKGKSLASIFQNVQPDVLVVGSAKDAAPLAAAETVRPAAVVALEGEGDGILPYDALLQGGAEAPDGDCTAGDLAIVMHTSGTTAAPKGAMMRHEDLLFNVMTTVNAHQFCASDVHLLVNPMFHCTALYSSLPTAAYQKTPVVITADTSPKALMALVAKERVTTFLSTPYIFQQVVKLPGLAGYDCSSLRLIAYAGAPMPVELVGRLEACFPGVELHNFFGLTETISMTHVLTGEEARERPDSIGRLLPFVEAVVIGADGRPAPPGAEGELVFARGNAVSGYYNRPEKMADALSTRDGREWFSTGDLASVDEDGFFSIKGRKKDMIIVGGENVFAAEIETFLRGHEKVRDAAVTGVPATGVRASLGELIKACVEPEDPSLTEREIRKYCHENLASYKIPHCVVLVDRLPRNPAGKVVKSDLP